MSCVSLTTTKTTIVRRNQVASMGLWLGNQPEAHCCLSGQTLSYGNSTPELRELELSSYVNPSQLRPQDSNLDLTAPKAVVLPLHQGGSRDERPTIFADNGRMGA